MVRGRRAEPCVAQRADRAPGEDWLPKSFAAHCITSYPVGLLDPYPPSACLRRGSLARMRPIYETTFEALGWHGHPSSIPTRRGEAATPSEVSVYAFMVACSGIKPVVR